MQVPVLLLFVMQIHLQVIKSVDIVGSGAKALGDLNNRISGDRSMLQQERIFDGELLVKFVSRSIEVSTRRLPDSKLSGNSLIFCRGHP